MKKKLPRKRKKVFLCGRCLPCDQWNQSANFKLFIRWNADFTALFNYIQWTKRDPLAIHSIFLPYTFLSTAFTLQNRQKVNSTAVYVSSIKSTGYSATLHHRYRYHSHTTILETCSIFTLYALIFWNKFNSIEFSWISINSIYEMIYIYICHFSCRLNQKSVVEKFLVQGNQVWKIVRILVS